MRLCNEYYDVVRDKYLTTEYYLQYVCIRVINIAYLKIGFRLNKNSIHNSNLLKS